MIDVNAWRWHSEAGHYVLSSRCSFRLHTTVGYYKISSVGGRWEKDRLIPIGAFHHFETMVFDLRADLDRWLEVDSMTVTLEKYFSKHTYEKTVKDVELNHLAMCYKYAAIQ